jgi:hypothetical protein
VTSTCVTCSYKKCDQYTGLTQTCPVGFYFSSSSTFSCSTCGSGYYCADGVSRVTASSTWPVQNSQNGTPQRCPAGYYCSYNSITITSDSYYSLSEQSTQTEVEYYPSRDLAGTSCPDNSYRRSNGLYCQLTSFGNSRNSQWGETGCTSSGNMAWIGEACESIVTN